MTPASFQSRGVRTATNLAVWLLPSLFCFWMYRAGLKTWFQQDDFAWLGLLAGLHQPSDLWQLLFQPMAQGTIRPISERAFFLTFTALFGMDALPFRLTVFITQIANVLLLTRLVRRLTGSRLAAFAAPVLWLVNTGLMVPMSWTSSYNQILCATFLLTAFTFFLKYVETGKSSFYVAQFVVFVIGFGVLELNVVYPVLVLAYCLLLARPFLRPAVPLVIPAALFTVIHRMNAPAEAAPGYGLHVDGRLFSTLYTYWSWLLGPAKLGEIKVKTAFFTVGGTIALTVAVLAYVAYKTSKKQYLPLFFLIWILAVLGPVLPLPEHISDYYLAVPSIGIGVLGALALADGVSVFRQRPSWRTVLAPLVATAALFLYLDCQFLVTRVGVAWWCERGRRAQAVVEGVAAAAEQHPGKTILLAGVDHDVFWSTIHDSPFRLYGLTNVFLVPGSERTLQFDRYQISASQFVLAPRAAKLALDQNEAVVYDAGQVPIRNVTSAFAKGVAEAWPTGPSPQVKVTDRVYASQMGEGWYDPEQGFRWSKPRATLTLGRGDAPPHRVVVAGYAVAIQTQSGPLGVLVSVNGKPLGKHSITAKDAPFEFSYILPAELENEKLFTVEIKTDRPTVPPGESRELGLALISVRLE